MIIKLKKCNIKSSDVTDPKDQKYICDHDWLSEMNNEMCLLNEKEFPL